MTRIATSVRSLRNQPVRVVRFHFIQATGSHKTQKELQEIKERYEQIDQSNRKLLGLT